MSLSLRIIRPASREKPDMLTDRLAELREEGAEVIFKDTTFDPTWPFAAAPKEARLKQLVEALTANEPKIIWCARGGYGASDLLADIPWDKLERAAPKLIVGFSDISALHSAVNSRLGWPALHAPMPATTLWGLDEERRDIDMVWGILKGDLSEVSLNVELIGKASSEKTIEGELFGGCFSVLSNLIGTPFFPESLSGKILFLEDTSENPGKLMRYFNQWQQAGKMDGVKALVLGVFRDCVSGEQDIDKHIYEQFAKRAGVPVFKSSDFGHVCPNLPLMIGAKAKLTAKSLEWRLQKGFIKGFYDH